MADFWRGRRVFMTGDSGFKGGWLALWLAELGAVVRGYSLPAHGEPNLFDAARVGESIEHLDGDVRDADALRRALLEFEPEVVFHLAAQPLVREGYADPAGTYATNVMGTVHLLEACRASPTTKAVVVVTTDKCYANREWDWGYRENEPMGGHDPYSNSKGCAELIVAAYRDSFFGADGEDERDIAVASARAGNVIGGGDWAADRLVPDLVRGFAAGETVRVRCPDAVRPWQHVLEPLDGYLTLARRLIEDGPCFAGGWNFGPRDEDAAPVRWVVQQMAERWGDGAAWALDGTHQPAEATLLKLDISKARARLGWTPRLGLSDTLDWVTQWYREYHDGGDVRQMTLQQTRRFRELKAGHDHYAGVLDPA